MKNFFRLLRYGLPYGLQWFPGVLLLAMVGVLDTFRTLLFQPIFDQVLRPDAPEGPITLGMAHSQWHFDLRSLVPHFIHMHNAWNVVAFALVSPPCSKASATTPALTWSTTPASAPLLTCAITSTKPRCAAHPASFTSTPPAPFSPPSSTTLTAFRLPSVPSSAISSSSSSPSSSASFFVIKLGGYLSWALLLFIPVVITSSRKIGSEVRTRTRTGQDKLAEIQNILHETVTGNRIVKAFNTELWEILRFKKAASRLFRANLRSVRIQSISSPLMDTIGAIAIAMFLFIGRNEIMHGRMTMGMFGAFIILLFNLYNPVRKFAYFYNSFQQAMGASMSIFSFFDVQDDVKERPHAVALKKFAQGVKFENVGFSYSTEEGEHQILHNVDLDVQSGEVLAVVGPSGAGKSTLVNLIPRFFDVTSGRILIDGHDIRDLTLGSLRRHVAQVTQETILFNDTVRNNIAYGQPDVHLDLVEQAARNALAHDFILRMPQGYSTVIGEKGFRLSGGERQRMAIARAILKNAPILILDEATSSLDAESESLVQAALANLMQGRTVLVIAHRLGTIRRANRIAVLEDGRITAIGTHEELLTASPTYQRLYQLQFMDVPEPTEQDPLAPDEVGFSAALSAGTKE